MASLVVIDDDDTLRAWLVAVLRNARHAVRAYGDAESALAAIRDLPPELILADINLPGRSGLDLLETLRAEEATAALPVILITSDGPRKVYRRGMELGADDFIHKPLTIEDVTRAVATRLERARVLGAAAGEAPQRQAMPARVGRFAIESVLARGVFTEVYLGRDAAGERAALKVLNPASHADRDELRARFEREMRVATAVTHPNLARVLESGIAPEGPFVAFEYFPMGDLAHLAQGALSPNVACRVASQVAAGLGALHAAGVIHRDVKPANIMVRSAHAFVLTDFGTAKLTAPDAEATPGPQAMGTPAYVSPEQIRRDPVTPASDFYSLGVVFYELLAGMKPFAASDYHAVLNDHLHTAPPPLPRRLARFQALVDRLLAKDPAARFASAAGVVAAVEAIAY